MVTSSVATAPKSSEVWAERAKAAGLWFAIGAVAFLIGAYIFAPNRQRAQDNYLPSTFVSFPTGVVTLSNADGQTLMLPVRIADTTSARSNGFAGVGLEALDNQFLLYAQTRQVSARTSYSVENVRAPLDLAIIDGEGNVVSIVNTSIDQTRVSVADPHRWMLAAKAGTFSHYGIEPGMTLDIEAIRKLNL